MKRSAISKEITTCAVQIQAQELYNNINRMTLVHEAWNRRPPTHNVSLQSLFSHCFKQLYGISQRHHLSTRSAPEYSRTHGNPALLFRLRAVIHLVWMAPFVSRTVHSELAVPQATVMIPAHMQLMPLQTHCSSQGQTHINIDAQPL